MSNGHDGLRDALPPTAPTVTARLTGDEAVVRKAFTALSESYDEAGVATAMFEQPDGRWTLALHFVETPNQTAVRALVALAAGADAANAIRFETVAPQQWVAASLAGLAPVSAGRFVVHGAHDRDRVSVNCIGIEIEAGLAFGTGHHATTRGCLIALERLVKTIGNSRLPRCGRRRAHPARVLDLGTGTGVLAIAAARVMHQPVVASDIDPIAIRVARANARLNRVDRSAITFVVADGLRRANVRARGPYALILANVLLEPLRRMATDIAQLTAPGGRVVLSGLLASQARTAIAVYRSRGLVLETRLDLDGWVTLVLARRKQTHAHPANPHEW